MVESLIRENMPAFDLPPIFHSQSSIICHNAYGCCLQSHIIGEEEKDGSSHLTLQILQMKPIAIQIGLIKFLCLFRKYK